MSRIITEHELTFALNYLSADNAMGMPDHELAAKLVDIIDTNRGEHPTLVAGEQCGTSNFTLGECSASQSNPIDDAVRLSHAVASVTEALAQVSGLSAGTASALTGLVEALATKARASLGQTDVKQHEA